MATLIAFSGAAIAQPKAPAPAPAPKVAGPQPSEDTFERDLDALFSAGGLTAEQAATRSAKTSPTVRRSVADVEVAIAQAQQAELSRVPRIGANFTYTRLSDVDSALMIPGGGSFEFPVFLNTYSADANIRINLSDYVVRYPKIIEAARLGEEVARVSRRSSEVNAGQDARLTYYEWVRSKLQVLIAERQLTQVRSTLGQIRALAEAQRVSRADLMRVESNEAVADQTVTQLKLLQQLREEQLRILIDEPSGTPLSIGEDIRQELAAPTKTSIDDAMKAAREQRLDFKVLDTGIVAKEKQRAAEKASLYPTLSGFASAEYSNPNQRFFGNADSEFNFSWAAGLQLSWTLNDTLFAKTTDRRLRGETDGLRADRENLDRGARIQIIASQQAIENARTALETSKKGLAAAEEGYRVRRELLNAERATAVELVDAETDLTRARITALNARVDLRVAIVQLEHAIGNDAK
ncbi:MAG: TolC family protein [Kofleriaceae bacterium]